MEKCTGSQQFRFKTYKAFCNYSINFLKKEYLIYIFYFTH